MRVLDEITAAEGPHVIALRESLQALIRPSRDRAVIGTQRCEIHQAESSASR
jgi:hypothetical protein